jgi:hypothetical protein
MHLESGRRFCFSALLEVGVDEFGVYGLGKFSTPYFEIIHIVKPKAMHVYGYQYKKEHVLVIPYLPPCRNLPQAALEVLVPRETVQHRQCSSILLLRYLHLQIPAVRMTRVRNRQSV